MSHDRYQSSYVTFYSQEYCHHGCQDSQRVCYSGISAAAGGLVLMSGMYILFHKKVSVLEDVATECSCIQLMYVDVKRAEWAENGGDS